MEENYTKQELLDWFETMIKKYPHCPMTEHLETVRFKMFNKNCELDNINNIIKRKEETQ